MDTIRRPRLNIVRRAAVRITIGCRVHAARATFAVLNWNCNASGDFSQIKRRRQSKLRTRQRQAAQSARRICTVVVSRFPATRRVDAAVDSLPFFRVVARNVNPLNFHVIKQTWAVGVLSYISRRPKRSVHNKTPCDVGRSSMKFVPVDLE
jgi:hypothetical protein